MTGTTTPRPVKVAFDDYPQTKALKTGEVKSARLRLEFSDIKPANSSSSRWCASRNSTSAKWRIGTFLQAQSLRQAAAC